MTYLAQALGPALWPVEPDVNIPRTGEPARWPG